MTQLTRWDPLRDLATMQNRINLFVRESYSPEAQEIVLTTANFAQPLDIYQDEHTITVNMEVSVFFNDTATTEIYTLSLHDALPISPRWPDRVPACRSRSPRRCSPCG